MHEHNHLLLKERDSNQLIHTVRLNSLLHLVFYLKSVLNLLQSLERDTLASQIHVRLTLQNLVIKNLVNALYQSLGGLMKLQETEH